MTPVARALAGVRALVGALAPESRARAVLASKPHPDFSVGPLLVIASVRTDLAVTVDLSFSLTPGREAMRTAREQDLAPPSIDLAPRP